MKPIQIRGIEGGPLIVSPPPGKADGRVQIDVGTPAGGLAYVVLTPKQVAILKRALR